MKGRENIESDGFALDWVGSMCRHWEKNDPMEIGEGDYFNGYIKLSNLT